VFAAGRPNATLSVETVVVAPTPFREILRATGTLRAREAVTIRSERAGVVRAIGFDEGTRVAAGDVLLEIDDRDLVAVHQRAAARLELATASERRLRELVATKNASQATYDTTLAELHVARAELALAAADLAKTVIRAPFDAVAGLREISVGTYLAPGAAIVDLAAVDTLKLDFGLPERYQRALEVGTAITFGVPGLAGTFGGRVYAMEPSIDVDTRSLRLRAEVPNPDGVLRPGAFAEIEVALDEIPDAILIPAIALVPGVRQPTVLVVVDGVVESRAVEVGVRTTEAVRIDAGLAPGDRVIVTGILQLRDGMPVTPVDYARRG
jgi:membrane fusion protein, multidrug efflux system